MHKVEKVDGVRQRKVTKDDGVRQHRVTKACDTNGEHRVTEQSMARPYVAHRLKEGKIHG